MAVARGILTQCMALGTIGQVQGEVCTLPAPPVGRGMRDPRYFLCGQKYGIRARLEGPSGASADIVSAWVVRTGEEFPRFVTAYPEGSR